MAKVSGTEAILQSSPIGSVVGVNRGARAWDKDHSMEDAIEALHREGTISHHVDGRGA